MREIQIISISIILFQIYKTMSVSLLMIYLYKIFFGFILSIIISKYWSLFIFQIYKTGSISLFTFYRTGTISFFDTGSYSILDPIHGRRVMLHILDGGKVLRFVKLWISISNLIP